MTITITLDHSDIACTDENDFQALCFILQTYAKITRAQLPTSHLSKIDKMAHDWADKKLENVEKTSSNEDPKPAENSPEAKTPPVEDSINRKGIEAEIKQIATAGKEKGVSKKIKEFIHDYGVEKLSDVPNEKIQELLEKVKAL